MKGGKVVFKSPKTAKGRRTIALPPSAVLLLKEHHESQKLERVMLGIPLSDDDLVFSHFDGKMLLPNTMTHAWIKLVGHAELKPIRLHDARHTHASLTLKTGNAPQDSPGEARTCEYTDNPLYLQSRCPWASTSGGSPL